jgi:hypothetical protein
MTNVYQFPGKKSVVQAIRVKSLAEPRVKMIVSGWLWSATRSMLFILLYWLRIPVVGFFRLISGPLLLFCFVGYFLLPPAHKWEILAFSAGLSLSSFVLAFLFDCLLAKLSPDNFLIER